MVAKRQPTQGEATVGRGLRQVSPRLLDGPFVADPLGPVTETREPTGRGDSIGPGVRPATHSVVVAVADEAAPQLRDVRVVQADEVARDRPAGETGEEDCARVAAVLATDPRHYRLAVGDRLCHVTPPLPLVLPSRDGDVRKANPDEALATANAEAEI